MVTAYKRYFGDCKKGLIPFIALEKRRVFHGHFDTDASMQASRKVYILSHLIACVCTRCMSKYKAQEVGSKDSREHCLESNVEGSGRNGNQMIAKKCGEKREQQSKKWNGVNETNVFGDRQIHMINIIE